MTCLCIMKHFLTVFHFNFTRMVAHGGKVILILHLWKLKHRLRDVPKAMYESMEELKLTHTLNMFPLILKL